MEEALSGAQAIAKLRSFACDALLLDRYLPDLNAQEVAEIIRTRYPEIEIRLLDSREEGTVLPTGSKEPVRAPGLIPPQSVDSAPAEAEVGPLPGMLGETQVIQQAYRLARLVAARDTTVLITGETGTGKELVARAIHQIGPRAKSPFVVVNCAAIPETLLEAELFGHARGAFTGAVQSRLGRIHIANGGTLFLDEIGELPLSMQAKLLRFLQDGEVQRLGSSDVFRVDVRVICATNVDLIENIKQKLFRQDLFYRLAVFPIEVPPLRERSQDIAPLAEHFLTELCRKADVPPKRLSASTLALLRQRTWPGNVRELQHAVERAFILAEQNLQLHVEHFGHAIETGHLREN